MFLIFYQDLLEAMPLIEKHKSELVAIGEVELLQL